MSARTLLYQGFEGGLTKTAPKSTPNYSCTDYVNTWTACKSAASSEWPEVLCISSAVFPGRFATVGTDTFSLNKIVACVCLKPCTVILLIPVSLIILFKLLLMVIFPTGTARV